MKEYDHNKIELKWQKEWEKKKVYQTLSAEKAKKAKKEPFYVLDMFPYPSGAGLHVGHPRGYIGSDVYARMKRMQGFNVLHPMGYDAFGLPAEQYAIEHKVHPSEAVRRNVATFEKQLSIIGLSYDWTRKVNTTDPEYYKWTQWIFLKLYNSWYSKSSKSSEASKSSGEAKFISELIKIFEKEGNNKVNAHTSDNVQIFSAKDWKKYSELEKQDILMNYRLAYEGHSEVNWCQKLGTVLANDEIVDDKDGKPVSERGNYPVEKMRIKQWFLRITAYADRLLDGLEGLSWSSHLKEIQKNWIGKSEGSLISFQLTADSLQLGSLEVFTTRADTLFGCTYVVLAPEHELVKKLKSNIENWDEIGKYIEHAGHKENQERMDDTKEKTGVELKGISAINPANGESVPVWISDYVLADYGTGAIMAVPQHDERDRAFALKFNLPIVDRPLVDMVEITNKVGGKIVTKYKMRDAIFARQRYWGEPIPLYRDKNGLIHEVTKLPLKLPNVKSYEPTGRAEGPLAGVKAWTAKGYETNTMPGWAGSSWYFLRYMDPKNKKELAAKKEMDYWNQVDVYVGGAEHATGHLLYSRFWNKFLHDLGVVPTEEPFKELHNQGMIIAQDGRRMSKRWGNVVNPDDIVKTYGADTLRVYEMFMGPFTDSIAWSTESIIGSRRFLEKVWRVAQTLRSASSIGPADFSSEKSAEVLVPSHSQRPLEHAELRYNLEKLLHKTIKKVTEDITNFNFNTAISSMMIFVNEVERNNLQLTTDNLQLFLIILAPFAPHMTEELWQQVSAQQGRNSPRSPGLKMPQPRGSSEFRPFPNESIHLSEWPEYDPKLIIDETVKIVVQVNGKVRTEINIQNDASEDSVKEIVMKNDVVQKWVENKPVRKFIYIKNKLVNIVV
ncbi:MAG: Leucine-tRNA ligase [Candidatus Nomurabacteria bacterium GW2011_GWB1_37_5]|uniref:Leucine--tRNA ligase n=1 Tax=Candidatus Nomurabacteria bacterium GW2011_GWB1_37_5 TaxID=1618742 RepID=A0A0G0GXS2_9BACT|nr:MAG: Leucine-tRNA ligase [Candidatus Nomurabacteria bacterium GW2011_GWB1_37_5]